MIVGAVVHMDHPDLAQWDWYYEGTKLPFPKDAIPIPEAQDPVVVARFHAHFPEYFIPGLS